MAILNDSTGTLMSCAHKNHNCKIGIIIGKKLNYRKLKFSYFWFDWQLNRYPLIILFYSNAIEHISFT